MGDYNVTLWRVGNDGKAFSASVAEVVNGKIVRWNGASCEADAGTEGYHARLVRDLTTFAGRPCKLFVSNGTKGFRAAICKPMHEAFVAQFQREMTTEGVR